jgi:capsid assembly protease
MSNSTQVVRNKIKSPMGIMAMMEGVEIIPIDGPIVRFREGRGITVKEIESAFTSALRNSAIKKIIFDVNCQGGGMEGLSALANYIYEARKIKPIFSLTDANILSAGYWLASAASKIYLGSKTASVGSLGLRVQFRDMTPEEKSINKGIEATGKFKSAWDPEKSNDPELRAYRESCIAGIHDTFVEDAARFRGLSIAEVQTLADGREFYGQEAITAQLADAFYDVFEWKFNHNLIVRGE